MSIDWKRKLTSRKFWVAVCEFVSMLIIALGIAQETAVQVSALIMAGATVIAYIIGEGLVDASSAVTIATIIDPEQEPPDEDE